MANLAALILLLPAVAFAFMGFFAVDDFVSMLNLGAYPVASYSLSVLFFAACVLFSVAGFAGAVAA
jgi:hypothetical protein